MGKMAGRALLQDLVKAAMVDSADRMSVTNEALRQSEKTASEEKKSCSKCGKEKCACGDAGMKTAAQQVESLASAMDYIAGELRKEAEHLQTSAPGVLEAQASTPLPDHKGQGVHVTPMHTGMQSARKGDPATQVPNNANEPVAGTMMETNYGKKSASVADIIHAKLASDEAEKKETEGMAEAEKGLAKAEKAHASEPENKGKEAAPADLASYIASRVSEKVAEDAINPAKISAGKAVPPDTSAAGEAGGAPVGGAPKGPTGLVGSAESAIKYTRGAAYANRKNDLRQYFTEPAMSAAHDSTLQVAFKNTAKAGPKIASAEGASPVAASVKTAAARVLLSQLAADVEAKNTTGSAGV